MLEFFAYMLGLVPLKEVRARLNFAYSVGKRLDEHRELVEAIESKTSLFQESPWHIHHLATQDDYLMRCYFMVHDCWPTDVREGWRQRTGEFVRPRPAVLGKCTLPEFTT